MNEGKSNVTMTFDYNENDLLQSTAVNNFETVLHQLKGKLCGESRTAKQWIRYIQYVDMIKPFLVAETHSKLALASAVYA